MSNCCSIGYGDVFVSCVSTSTVVGVGIGFEVAGSVLNTCISESVVVTNRSLNAGQLSNGASIRDSDVFACGVSTRTVVGVSISF